MRTRRPLWLLWVAVLALLIAVVLFPVSTQRTRLAGAVLSALAWISFLALNWRNGWMRSGLLAFTVLCCVFFALPARASPQSSLLRSDYVSGLRHYMGVGYVWGGESVTGIDCSGLIRRGLVDSLFCRGIRSFNPALSRYAIWLWWHDTTAAVLGDDHHGLTVRLFEVPSINALNDSRIVPGDLAVTASGIHIMAYVGDHGWIEADPTAARVITVQAPSTDNPWFHQPMRIMRWSILR